MADIYTLIPPDELAEIARLALADEDRDINRFQLERWFPNENVDGIEVQWSTGTTRAYTAAAPIRSFTTPPRIGTRPGTGLKRAEMAPISIMYPLTEYDMIRQREVGRIGGSLSRAVEEYVYRDIEAGIQAVRSRMEQFRAEFLLNGSLAISENGVKLTVDSGRISGRESGVSVAWSTAATATPLNDEQAVLDIMAADEALGPDQLIAIMNTTTWRYYRNSDQVRENFQSFRVYETLTPTQVNEVRGSLGFPDVFIYDARATSVAGVNAKLIPDGRVIYVPRFPVGGTYWGVPASADFPELELVASQRPGPIAFLMREIAPPVLYTVVDALGMPIFRDPDATYSLDVVP
jgi:hypothetical protein